MKHHDSISTTLTRGELRSVLAVSLIVSLRLLGIFLLIPVFSVSAIKYKNASLLLVGIAFGIYPLVQGLFQIPFGWASDRLGRRGPLLLGLLLFSVGSYFAYLSTDIYQLIAARAVQGSGAVGSVAMAALGDLTREKVRAQAFTIAGISIGAAFVLGILGGPILAAHYGFSALFAILAVLGVVAFLVALVCFPKMKLPTLHRQKEGILALVARLNLRRLYTAALVCSLTLNLFFFLYPISWMEAGVGRSGLWKIYLLVLLPSLVVVFPYIRRAEKKGRLAPVPIIGYVTMISGYFIYLVGGRSEWSLYATAALFFLGYTLYQSILPTLLTQRTPPERRGTAIGFYNLAGFLGASFGGILAGGLYGINPSYPILLGLGLLVLWLFTGLPNAKSDTSNAH